MHYLDTQDATPLQQNEEAATCNTEMHTLNALEENIHLMSQTSLNSIDIVTWNDIREATSSDTDLHHLSNLITTGLPESREHYPSSLKEYHRY